MYVHCGSCSWGQDDFWSKDYNPIKSLQDRQELLLDFEKLDKPFFPNADEARACGAEPTTTHRQVVELALNRALRQIQQQRFLTPADAKGAKCPDCGGHLIED